MWPEHHVFSVCSASRNDEISSRETPEKASLTDSKGMENKDMSNSNLATVCLLIDGNKQTNCLLISNNCTIVRN